MNDSDRKGIKIISVIFLFFIALSILANSLSSKADGYDIENFCPLDEDYLTTNFVIDKTDPWTVHQKERIKSVILEMKSSLKLHERLKIYILGHHKLEIEHPKFDLCNPGRGEQASPIYENPRRIQDKYNEKFSGPLDDILNELLNPEVAPLSPIISTLDILGNSNKKDKLILVSDLMENNGKTSFYQSIPRYSDWLKDVKINIPLPEYSNIKVYFIDRNMFNPGLKYKVKDFWKTHFDNIATQVSWNKL